MQRESLRRKIEEAKVNMEKEFAEDGTQNPSLRIAVESLLLVVDIIVVVLFVGGKLESVRVKRLS